MDDKNLGKHFVKLGRFLLVTRTHSRATDRIPKWAEILLKEKKPEFPRKSLSKLGGNVASILIAHFLYRSWKCNQLKLRSSKNCENGETIVFFAILGEKSRNRQKGRHPNFVPESHHCTLRKCTKQWPNWNLHRR